MKFGGTSVEDTAAFARVAQLVRQKSEISNTLPIIVVSAMSRMTNALLTSVESAAAGDIAEGLRGVEENFARHREVAGELLDEFKCKEFTATLSHAREEIESLLHSIAKRKMPRTQLQDIVASYGERLSATLLAEILNENDVQAHYVDARRCIVSDENFTNAAPSHVETYQHTRTELAPLIKQHIVPVLGGFIASTREGATTTLGRGGSDYSAALIGAAMEAREIQIWTDVTGVLTADPRVVPNARTLPHLSYAEAAELAYFGAKVLHPKTIQPAVERNIPVRICNSRAPEEAGTVVTNTPELHTQTIKSIAHKTGITTLQINSARMLGAYGFLRALFEIFERHRTVIDVVTTSEVSVSVTLDATDTLPAILRDLQTLGTVQVEYNRAIICVVGDNLRSTSGIAARLFKTLRDINITLISHGASSSNLTFIVDEKNANEAVRLLHREFIGN
ncbi:MAG: lysine-sensitive aspartokinase 3 [Pyrinomonadaceae bacterium]